MATPTHCPGTPLSSVSPVLRLVWMLSLHDQFRYHAQPVYLYVLSCSQNPLAYLCPFRGSAAFPHPFLRLSAMTANLRRGVSDSGRVCVLGLHLDSLPRSHPASHPASHHASHRASRHPASHPAFLPGSLPACLPASLSASLSLPP